MSTRGRLVDFYRAARAQLVICKKSLRECHDHIRKLQGMPGEQSSIGLINVRVAGLKVEVEGYQALMDEARTELVGMIEAEGTTKYVEHYVDKLLS